MKFVPLSQSLSSFESMPQSFKDGYELGIVNAVMSYVPSCYLRILKNTSLPAIEELLNQNEIPYKATPIGLEITYVEIERASEPSKADLGEIVLYILAIATLILGYYLFVYQRK